MANNYLDHIDGIDGAGNIVPILLQDRETLALANQINAALGNEIGARIAADEAESAARIAADSELQEEITYVKEKYVCFEDFGAVGDGVTDDTAAIQLALNSADGFLLQHKKYLISSHITITGNKFINGNGAEFILKAGSRIDTMFSQESGSLVIMNCVFDGQWQNNNYVYGTNSGGNMIRSAQPLFAIMALAELSKIVVDKCVFKNSPTVGLAVVNAQNAKVTNCRFISNLIHGFNFRRDGSRPTACKLGIISDNIAYGSVVGIEIIGGYENLSVTGNECHDCDDSKYFPSEYFNGTYPNIYPKGSGWNTPSDAGYVSPALEGDGSGIELTNYGDTADVWSPKYINVSGNTVRDSECGLRCEGRAHDVALTGNSVYHCKKGIFCFSVTRITVSGNTISGCDYGVNVETFPTDGNMCANININGNTISYATSYPIALVGVANSAVSGNTIISITANSIVVASLTGYVSRRISICDNIMVKDGGNGTLAIRFDDNVFGCVIQGNVFDGWNAAFNGYTLNLVGLNNGMTNVYNKLVTIPAGELEVAVDTSDIPFTIINTGVQATPLYVLGATSYYVHVTGGTLYVTLESARAADSVFAITINKVQQ